MIWRCQIKRYYKEAALKVLLAATCGILVSESILLQHEVDKVLVNVPVEDELMNDDDAEDSTSVASDVAPCAEPTLGPDDGAVKHDDESRRRSTDYQGDQKKYHQTKSGGCQFLTTEFRGVFGEFGEGPATQKVLDGTFAMPDNTTEATADFLRAYQYANGAAAIHT